MDKNYLNELNLRLKSMAVFRNLLLDDVMAAFISFLDNVTVDSYARFVSAVYESDYGDFAAHIKTAVGNNENIYMKLIGYKKTPDNCIKNAVENELKTLQAVADITSADIKSCIEWEGFLPDFTSSKIDIAQYFTHRVENIDKYGYGIYAKNRMFYISHDNRIVPVKNPDNTTLDSLIDYQRERKIIIDNTQALLAGKPAANILLTGDAGTGKSSTIKAVVNELYGSGLRIIEVRKEQLGLIPGILDELAVNPLKFILFIDDLAFLKDDDNFNALKAVLEGSVSAKSKNVAIYATSNRRHIVKEKFSDRDGDEVHRNDAMQEMISLSDRFGIHITFQKPDKATFLNIVHHMAKVNNIVMDTDELDLLAERFALHRGGRSARLAKQFIEGLLAK